MKNDYLCGEAIYIYELSFLVFPGDVVKCPRFLCHPPISHFKAHFRHFRPLGGITYYPDGKSVLNRKFGKNYFFLIKSEKIIKKVLEIKI